MTPLRATLDTDGSSDAVLQPLVAWTLKQHTRRLFDVRWCNPRNLPPARTLVQRLRRAVQHYPCELLFVHRDAEKESRAKRVEEILTALDALGTLPAGLQVPPAVCVVPVKMQEAWLLFDEPALRAAAKNPRGRVALEMPKLRNLERLGTKQRLHKLLRLASGLNGERLQDFQPDAAVHRLAALIGDFKPLRQLPAFQAFEADLRDVLQRNNWLDTPA